MPDGPVYIDPDEFGGGGGGIPSGPPRVQPTPTPPGPTPYDPYAPRGRDVGPHVPRTNISDLRRPRDKSRRPGPPPDPPGGGGSGGVDLQPQPNEGRPAIQRVITINANGGTIPYVAGHQRIGGNIFFAQTVGANAYIAFGLCEGPDDKILDITIDGHTLASLGLIEGRDYNVYLGTSSQAVDPLIKEADPTHVTGWPGLAYISFRFPPPTVATGSYDPTRILVEGRWKLVRDVRSDPVPTAPCGVAVGAAGLPNGDYYYKYTNVTPNSESAGGPVSAVVTLNLRSGSLTGILPGGGPVTKRNIYRTAAGDSPNGTFRYIGTIPDNISTVFTDNVPDSALGAEIPYTSTERVYSANPALIYYDLRTSRRYGTGVSERNIDGLPGGTFAVAADDCDFGLTRPASPASAPVITNSGITGVLGTGYYYSLTYVTASGLESLSSAPSSLYSPPLIHFIASVAFTVGPAGTVARKLYRTKANAGIAPPSNSSFGLVATIPDNTTTNYWDNIPDEMLGAGAPPTISRFEAGVYMRDAQQAVEWLATLRMHFMAYETFNSGLYQLFIHKAKAATAIAFTDQGPGANIIDLPTITSKGLAQVPTVVTITYTNSQRDWQDDSISVELPGVATGDLEALQLRGEERRELRLSLPFALTSDQATRVATETLNLGLADKTIQWDSTPEGVQPVPGDIVSVTSDIGLVNAPVLVTECEPTNDALRWKLRGSFYDASNYSDTIIGSSPVVPTQYPNPFVDPPDVPAGAPIQSASAIYWYAPRTYSAIHTKYGPGSWSQTGLSNYVAANVNDGILSSKAFDAAPASTGSLTLDAGTPKQMGKVRISFQASPTLHQQWAVEYSSDGTTWTATDAVIVDGAIGTISYTLEWPDVGAFRYWKIRKPSATVETGANYSEIQFMEYTAYPFVRNFEIWDNRSGTPSYWSRPPADPLPTALNPYSIANIVTQLPGGASVADYFLYVVNQQGLRSAGTRIAWTLAQSLTLSNGLNSNIALPAGTDFKIIGPTAPFSIGGFTGGSLGRKINLFNYVNQPLTILNGDTGSSIGNRIVTSGGSDVVVGSLYAAATLTWAANLWTLLGGAAPTPNPGPATNNITLSSGANHNVVLSKAFSGFIISGPGAAFSITGLTGGADGRIIELYNSTAYSMTIANENTGSSATNRITCLTGADIGLGAKATARFMYDPNSARWLCLNASDNQGGYTQRGLNTQLFDDVTGNGSWICPPGVFKAYLTGCGAGGGGGGANSSGGGSVGGGGGAGHGILRRDVTVIPGTQYDVSRGIGGAGGASAATTGATGTAGGATTFVIHSGATILSLAGGGGGLAGSGTGASNNGQGGAAGGPGGSDGEKSSDTTSLFGGSGGGSMVSISQPFSGVARQSPYGAGGPGGFSSSSGSQGGNGFLYVEW